MIRTDHHYTDQLRYSDEQIESVVRGVWDDTVTDDITTGWGSAVNPGRVPTVILEVADVCRAFYRCGLSEPERVVLRAVHWEGFLPGELAEAWGEAPERVDATAQSGIRKIRQYLNGETPQ